MTDILLVPDDEVNPETPNNPTPTPATRNITVTIVEEGTQDDDTPVKIGRAHIVCTVDNDIDAYTEEISADTGARGGSAVLSNVPDGTHTLTISADGYVTKTDVQMITSADNVTQTFTLVKE